MSLSDFRRLFSRIYEKKGTNGMKIFVGYGFNERDKWVENFVFPIIEAFGDEVITGEKLHGDLITEGVKQKIEKSDAFIGFMTRREEINKNKWTTHRWVTDEMAHALSKNLPAVEVRESLVDGQGGIADGRQIISYDEAARDKCLVELVQTIGKWHDVNNVKLQLLPVECAAEIIPLYRKPGFGCAYRFLVDGNESDEIATKIQPIKGGLFVEVKNVPRQALIQVNIKYQNINWISSFESTDSVGIYLRKD